MTDNRRSWLVQSCLKETGANVGRGKKGIFYGQEIECGCNGRSFLLVVAGLPSKPLWRNSNSVAPSFKATFLPPI